MSFLADYRLYTSGLEIPPSYNTFCSLVALSSILGRKVWSYKGDYIRVYPNLYVVLVGGPGVGKTTSMELSEELLHHFKIPVSAESVTREKLILDIQAQEQILEFLPPDDKYRVASPYTIFASELSEFLGAGGIGMISFLTDIYSRNVFESRTKNKGSTFIRGPYLNLIAGTTPDWITTYLKDDIISGGFSRRCIFVYESSRYGCVPRPRITPEMRAAWERVLARSSAIRKLAGPFVWDEGAVKFWDAWYPTRIPHAKDPNLVGYYETKDIQMLKIAMLVALSEGDKLVLTKEHFLSALDLMSLVEYNMSRVFQGIGRNEMNRVAVTAMDLINNSPKMKIDWQGELVEVPAIEMKRLQNFLWKDLQGLEIKELIEHLKTTDRIGEATKSVNGISRTYIYAKPAS
jgi:hypothetical protein